MKAQTSFLMKGIYLVFVLVAISIFIQLVINHNYAISKEMNEIELRLAADNTLNTLISKDCLAYEKAGTTHKLLDIKKIKKFENFYSEIEPECARSFYYGYSITVEKFESNVTFYTPKSLFTVCYIGGGCADPSGYLAKKPYRSKPIDWVKIANNEIGDCDAILIECVWDFCRGTYTSSTGVGECVCKHGQMCDSIKNNLIEFVKKGKLLVTTGDSVEVINFLFPNQYVKGCFNYLSYDSYICGNVYTASCPKCIELTEAGRNELNLTDVNYSFWVDFRYHGRLFQVLSDNVSVLANFSSNPCTRGNVYSPPNPCSNAVIVKFNYDSGTIVHQSPLLETAGGSEYEKINIFTSFLKSYAGYTAGKPTSFTENKELFKFGAKEFSFGDALRSKQSISLPVLIQVDETKVQPGKIKIEIVDGELEELSGIIDSVCFFNSSKQKSMNIHYQTYVKNQNQLCIKDKDKEVCRKLLCNTVFSEIKSPGRYFISMRKVGDTVEAWF